MSAESSAPAGHCACGEVRYRLEAEPLFVHCCHCRACQRETGTAFALNALIETSRVTVLSGKPESVLTPSNSGKGQDVMRCPTCRVALWSHYHGAGQTIAFIRVGTLENPDRFSPDVHIYTESRQPWLTIADGKPVLERYYKTRELWPATSLERVRKL